MGRKLDVADASVVDYLQLQVCSKSSRGRRRKEYIYNIHTQNYVMNHKNYFKIQLKKVVLCYFFVFNEWPLQKGRGEEEEEEEERDTEGEGGNGRVTHG